jgi:hypothetical protein
MTDRVNGFFVTLDKDIREDDAVAIRRAILMVRHVIDVQPHISDFEDHVAKQRVRKDLGRKIWDIIFPDSFLKARDIPE